MAGDPANDFSMGGLGWSQGAKEPSMSVWSFQDMLLHVVLNGRVRGASPFLFEGISGYLNQETFFSMSRIHKHTFSPRSKSPMKHCSTPSSFTPEKQPTEFYRGPRNSIMNPPKPSKTTYLPSTHR